MFTTKFSTKFITIITILLLTLSNVQPTLAASTTIKSSDTFPFSFFNHCTGEVVSGVISANSTIHEIIDANGGFIHVHLHDVYFARAVGETSGIQYVGTQIDQGGFQANNEDGLAQTFTLSYRFISRGSADNILTHILLHVTVTPNGEWIREIIDVTAVCGG